eukprot:TRINITY_DN27499_c0_g1_i3.p1 TRINITY_DN27499_c0_g1~~TRINITY_DN27499_c0_g1_i3.p1  ORF type:complete len:172 (+),score=31.35 TRINITY_DN27499_c0_g1_i3:185-700(+)
MCIRDSYYTKLLTVAGVANASQRFRFIVPENFDRLRRTHSLATVLLYSPRALKRISTFVGDRPAYIVPNLVGADDVRVSMKLEIPLLGPEDRISAIYSSKSGCKRLFAAAQVNMPPAAYDICLLYTSDAADEEDSVDLGGRRIIKKKNRNPPRQLETSEPYKTLKSDYTSA